MIEDGNLTADLIPVDHLGRREPHRMNVLTFMRAIPGFASQFQVRVPESFYSGKKKSCEVRCPCGSTGDMELGVMFACPGCERIYLYLGSSLRVGNSPTRTEVIPTE